MEHVDHWLAHTSVTAPEDLVDYSVNKVIVQYKILALLIICVLDVTFSFEKDHYTVNEEGGRVELCILQNGESIIDLSIIAAPQEFTAEGQEIQQCIDIYHCE